MLLQQDRATGPKQASIQEGPTSISAAAAEEEQEAAEVRRHFKRNLISNRLAVATDVCGMTAVVLVCPISSLVQHICQIWLTILPVEMHVSHSSLCVTGFFCTAIYSA